MAKGLPVTQNSFLQLFRQNEERKVICFVFWVTLLVDIILRY